jgi:transcriptional regulator with XRE-family HTH domain
MSELDYAKIFSKNLKRFLEMSDKKPADIQRDLGIPWSTLSNWLNGEKMPRMGNVEKLAQYLHVSKSDLVEDREDDIPESYYLTDEARDMAEFMFKNPEYRVLFDAVPKIPKKDIDFVKQMIDRMTGATDEDDSDY